MNGIDGGFGIAALGGLISFLSPCVLPLVPAYLCFMAGTTLDELTDTESRGPEAARALNRRVFAAAIGFVLGFSTVFVAMGAAASAINPLLMTHRALLGQVAGAVIIVLGLHYMGVFKLAFLNREARFMPSFGGPDAPLAARMIAPYVIGLAFAFGWTPCIGPILAAILTIAASQESLGYGVALLATYSLGLGIPFLAAAFGVRAFLGFSTKFRHHMHKVEIAAGILLVGTGLLMMLGSFELIAVFLIDTFPALGELG